MSLNIQEIEQDGVLILELRGRITTGEGAAVLGEAVRDALERRKKHILLDMAAVTYTDAAGIGELVRCYTSVGNQGGALKLLDLRGPTRHFLSIHKLVGIFEVFNDRAVAIRSFA